MDNQDRQAIDGLFKRLEDAQRQAPPRDADAERLIGEQIARQPGAPYYMAQTIVMQEYALEQAQARITALEEGARAKPQSGGGLFGGLFGGGSREQQTAAPGAYAPRQAAAPMGQAPGFNQAGRGGGGGFLAGAAQTAMGVAGGVLLGNAVMGMFSGGEAQAAEAPAETGAEDVGSTEASDEGGGGMFDGFFGGDGGDVEF